jgi:hypothetical protein
LTGLSKPSGDEVTGPQQTRKPAVRRGLSHFISNG